MNNLPVTGKDDHFCFPCFSQNPAMLFDFVVLHPFRNIKDLIVISINYRMNEIILQVVDLIRG